MTEIIARKDAKSQGLKFYFTGKECKHGHVDKRIVSNGRCYECARLAVLDTHHAMEEEERSRVRSRRQKWREENREAVRAQSQSWRDKNRECVRAYTQKYREENAEHINSRQRAYYRADREGRSARNKEWRDANPWHGSAASAASRNGTKNFVRDLSDKEYAERIEVYKRREEIRGELGISRDEVFAAHAVEVDHIIPVHLCERFGINPEHPSNLHWATKENNRKKWDRIPIND